MRIPPLKLKYTKVECSIEEEQRIIDDMFDILFNFVIGKTNSNNDVVRDLTITGV